MLKDTTFYLEGVRVKSDSVDYGVDPFVAFQAGDYMVIHRGGHAYWASTLEPRRYAPGVWWLVQTKDDGRNRHNKRQYRVVETIEECEPGRFYAKEKARLIAKCKKLAGV